MLQLKHISLLQFKNYTNKVFEFNKKIVAICGKNGVGKTNILDAIHYLCFTKSYFSNSDIANVQQGAKGFRIEGLLNRYETEENAVCILRENNKKEFLINGEAYEKFSLHIGRYPCVVIAPDDAVLITGGSDERRSFLDTVLSQLGAAYLQNLILYNKVLSQRNVLLKSAAEIGKIDESLLQILTQQLIAPANIIFETRNRFLTSFLPKVRRLYTEIAQKEEGLSILYDSSLQDTSFETLLSASTSKDKLLQRTTAGIHRDDIILQLNGQPFKNTASQGQRKSLLFALKLTELDVITTEKKMAPILMLDDVFEKLDESRISSLLQKVCVENEGQVFITDTNKDRLSTCLQKLNTSFDLISL